MFSFLTHKKKHYRNQSSRGFSLIELLAVTAIMVVITAVVLANSSKLGGAITLRNLTYEVALTVRQAQAYGIAVRRFGPGEFQYPYGMHFHISSPEQYVLFADADNPQNGNYDGGSELVDLFTISRNFQITDLCVRQIGASEETCGLQRLDITFERPEPDALIRYNGGSSLNESARITLMSPRGDLASIVVELSGQISVR